MLYALIKSVFPEAKYFLNNIVHLKKQQQKNS